MTKSVKVSVITPTIRKAGLDIVRESLLNQTYTDWEWVVCSPFKVEDAVWVYDDSISGVWSLNRAYNALFKKAQGEIIVSWQDFIWMPTNALDKIVADVEFTQGVVTGVGDQYARLNEDTGKPEVKIWDDPRKTDKFGTFYECLWNDAEFNFAAFPKKLAYEVGGFDEKLDFLGVGGDQLSFCERLNDIGAKFYIDQSCESFTLRHGREDFGGQEEWDAKHVLFNGEYNRRKRHLIETGEWPILTYL